MASAAAPQKSKLPYSRKWTPISDTFLMKLAPLLNDTEFCVMGQIFVETIGRRREWWAVTLDELAMRTLRHPFTIQQAVNHLTELGFLLFRRVGRGKDYSLNVEHIERESERMYAAQLKTYIEEKAKKTSRSAENMAIAAESTTKTCGIENQAEENGPGHDQARNRLNRSNQATAPPAEVDELEEWLTQTITPRLFSCPPLNFIEAAIKNLAGAPVEWLKNKILAKLPVFTSWGFLPQLASDVGEAYARLRLVPRHHDIDFGPHWASSVFVRRLFQDPATPEAARNEILQMWPELGRKKSRAEDLSERIKHL